MRSPANSVCCLWNEVYSTLYNEEEKKKLLTRGTPSCTDNITNVLTVTCSIGVYKSWLNVVHWKHFVVNVFNFFLVQLLSMSKVTELGTGASQYLTTMSDFYRTIRNHEIKVIRNFTVKCVMIKIFIGHWMFIDLSALCNFAYNT